LSEALEKAVFGSSSPSSLSSSKLARIDENEDGINGRVCGHYAEDKPLARMDETSPGVRPNHPANNAAGVNFDRWLIESPAVK